MLSGRKQEIKAHRKKERGLTVPQFRADENRQDVIGTSIDRKIQGSLRIKS